MAWSSSFERVARWLVDQRDEATEQVLATGEVLFRAGDPSDAIYEVVSGRVVVSVPSESGTVPVASLGVGEVLGEIGLISGSARTATVTAEGPVVARRWGAEVLRQHLDGEPELERELLRLTRSRLRKENLLKAFTTLVGHVDDEAATFIESRATWVEVARGDALFEQGATGTDWYVLVSGRLHVAVRAQDGSERIVASIAPGATVGEIGALTDGVRNATVTASRQCSLARFTAADLETLDGKLPGLFRAMTASLLRAQFVRRPSDRRTSCVRVAVVGRPTSRVAAFTVALENAARGQVRTLIVNAESLESMGFLGPRAATTPNHPGWLRVRTWLDAAEPSYDLCLLWVDDPSSSFATAAVDMSDRVLWLASPETSPTPTPEERALFAHAREIRSIEQHLCLVHPTSTPEPRGTMRWLVHRPGIQPLHVRAGDPADAERIARLLARRAFVLVLGGGGARGLSHLGVARALHASGVPIDAVCGTSIGGIIAAQLATRRSHADLMAMNHEAIAVRPFQRFTLPWVSLMSMSGFERMAQIAFADRCAEDLWLPFFSTATGLSTKTIVILDRGPLRDIALASAALPGVFPPVPRDGQLLVDGGVLDNLPTERARSRWGGTIMAVTLDADVDLEFTGEQVPSGWRLAASRLGLGTASAPSLGQLLGCTMTIGSSNRELRSAGAADVVFRPPISHIGLTEMERLDEIERAGFTSARTALQHHPIPVPQRSEDS